MKKEYEDPVLFRTFMSNEHDIFNHRHKYMKILFTYPFLLIDSILTWAVRCSNFGFSNRC